MRVDEMRPNIVDGTHPIQRGRYLLMTPVIEEFYDAVSQWITNRTPGGMIYGRPRLGKSTAIEYLTKLLPEQFGNIPIITFLCRDYKVPSERAFFSDFLDSAGHGMLGGEPTKRRNRLRDYLFQIAHQSGQDRLILFADEAQKLHEQQYRWLIDVNNELNNLGVSLIALLVGQEELIHQYTAFSYADKAQIIGRFMLHRFQFRGLKNIDDIRASLKSYDSNSEFPEGSGWSYTRFFFPSAFQRGWRLASTAEDLWKAFCDINDQYGIPGRIEIPMQYFCRAVEHVLISCGTDNSEATVSENSWKEGIEISRYVDLERYYAVQGEKVK